MPDKNRNERLAASVSEWASRLGPDLNTGMTLRQLATLVALGQLPDTVSPFISDEGLRFDREKTVGPWTMGIGAQQPFRREMPSVEVRASRPIFNGDVSLEAGVDPYRGRYIGGQGRIELKKHAR